MAEEVSKLIQVRLSKPAIVRIERLKQASGDPTMKQLFLNALSTYETLKELPEGASIIIEKKDSTRERLVIP